MKDTSTKPPEVQESHEDVNFKRREAILSLEPLWDSIKELNNRINELGTIKIDHTNMSNDFAHFKKNSRRIGILSTIL